MKKALLIMLSTLLLASCGSPKTDIRDTIKEDTERVLEIFEVAAQTESEPSSKEWDTLIAYEVKYESMKDREELTPDEEITESYISGIRQQHDNKSALPSANEEILEDIEKTRHFMKTGEFTK